MSMAPLTLTVVWHPSCAEGSVAAETLAEWFEPVNASNLLSGLRIPVRIRFKSGTAASDDAPIAVTLDEADVNLVLVLGTKVLMEAARGPWRDFFKRIVDEMAVRGSRDT